MLITIDSDFPTTRVSFFYIYIMKSSHFSSINPGIYQAKYTYIPLCYWLAGPYYQVMQWKRQCKIQPEIMCWLLILDHDSIEIIDEGNSLFPLWKMRVEGRVPELAHRLRWRSYPWCTFPVIKVTLRWMSPQNFPPLNN